MPYTFSKRPAQFPNCMSLVEGRDNDHGSSIMANAVLTVAMGSCLTPILAVYNGRLVG